MPDISLCNGGICPRKNTCYRFRAIPNEHRQSYFSEPPYERSKHCDYYWAIEAGDRLSPPAKEPDAEKQASVPISEVRNNSRFGPDVGDNRVAHPRGKTTRKAGTKK